MESQITKIEHDIEGIKNIVKKIRESNGRTERRLDMIEEFGDTMQQDLYLAIDMVRILTEKLAPKEENGITTANATTMTKYNSPPATPTTNPNIVAANELAAAAANAKAKRQQYHRDNSETTRNTIDSDRDGDTTRSRK